MSSKRYICKHCGNETTFGEICRTCREKLPYVKEIIRLGRDIKHAIETRQRRRRLIELYNSQKWKG